jgi:hypothetical protein
MPATSSLAATGNFPLLSWMYMIIAVASCFMLLLHCTVYAERRAPMSVGSRMR